VAGFGLYFLLYASLLFFLTLKEVVRRGIENHGSATLTAMTEAAADPEAPLLLPGDQAPATRPLLAPGGSVRLAMNSAQDGQQNAELGLVLVRGEMLSTLGVGLALVKVRLWHRPLYRAFRRLSRGETLDPATRDATGRQLMRSPWEAAVLSGLHLVVGTDIIPNQPTWRRRTSSCRCATWAWPCAEWRPAS